MHYEILVLFDNGRHEQHAAVGSLNAAAEAAFKLADDLGQRPASDGLGRPCWIQIRSDGHLELSIQIIPGGLNPKGDAPKSRAM